MGHSHATKGERVPIGGFLSAQLMCIWGLAIEHSFAESPNKLRLLQPVFDAWPAGLPALHIKPGPTLTFPHVAFVPRDRTYFEAHSMQGWFSREERLLFTLSFDSLHIPVYAMGLWDSHPEGRVGKIIDRSVRMQRRFLLQFFLNFRPTQCMCDT